MLRVLHASSRGFSGARALCATDKANAAFCSSDAIVSVFAHALLATAGIGNYSLTVQKEPFTNWGQYDAENGSFKS